MAKKDLPLLNRDVEMDFCLPSNSAFPTRSRIRFLAFRTQCRQTQNTKPQRMEKEMDGIVARYK